jgi:hypothetical protein
MIKLPKHISECGMYGKGHLDGQKYQAELNPWISVNGYEEMPIGLWLVKIDGNDPMVANIHEKLSFIGGRFTWDHKPVTHYKDIGLND